MNQHFWTQERLHLAQKNERVLLDVNSMAIFLVEDHPGNEYVSEEVEEGFTGDRDLVVMDYLPFRVHWIHTTKWDVEKKDSIEAIQSFLEARVEVVGMNREKVLETFEIAEEKDHDVYDCFYVSLARQIDATHILTTDEDFDALCEGESFEYLNPVPIDVIRKFHVFNK